MAYYDEDAEILMLHCSYGAWELDQAFLYHLRRVDSQHNFSPYFLPIALALESDAHVALQNINVVATLLQLFAVLGVSWRYRAHVLVGTFMIVCEMSRDY